MKRAPKKYDKGVCAERLRALREEKGLTQEALAKSLPVSRSTIVKMETGRQDIKPDYLHSLAQFYGTTTDYILGLTEVRRSAETLPACDELGISDTATAKLEEMRERQRYGRVLSKLIEHDFFEELLRHAENATLSFEPVQPNGDGDLKSLTALAKKTGYSLIPSMEKKSYELYMAAMTLQAIIADVLDHLYPVDTSIEAEDEE